MVLLEEYLSPTKLTPYPTRVITPIVSLESMEVMPKDTADTIVESVANNYLNSRGKQALLNELRNILLKVPIHLIQ